MYNIDALISSLSEEKFQNALELVSMEVFAKMVFVPAHHISLVQTARLKILIAMLEFLKKVFCPKSEKSPTFFSSMLSC